MQQDETNPHAVKWLKRTGWALLIVVLAFIAVFVENLVHVFRSAKIAAVTAAEVKYVKEADVALIQYTSDHGDRYPNLSGDMVSLLRPYIKDPLVVKAMGRFVWNEKLSGRAITDVHDPEGLVVLYSVVPGTQSIAVGMADGFARRLPKTILPKIIASANSLKPLSQFYP